MQRQRVFLTRTRHGYAIRSFDFTQNIFQLFEGKKARRRALRFASENGMNLMNDSSCIPADPTITQEDKTE